MVIPTGNRWKGHPPPPHTVQRDHTKVEKCCREKNFTEREKLSIFQLARASKMRYHVEFTLPMFSSSTLHPKAVVDLGKVNLSLHLPAPLLGTCGRKRTVVETTPCDVTKGTDTSSWRHPQPQVPPSETTSFLSPSELQQSFSIARS